MNHQTQLILLAILVSLAGATWSGVLLLRGWLDRRAARRFEWLKTRVRGAE